MQPTALFLGLIYALPTMSISAASVTLAWDPSPEPSLAGYRLHYGTTSGDYTDLLEVGNTVTATVSNLVGGTTYFFAATALDANGLESAYSSEISYTPPPLRTLTVKSLAATLPLLAITTLDLNGDGIGIAPLRRVYSNDSVITLTAPVINGTRLFNRWMLDGTQAITNLTATVTMDSDHTLVAMFGPLLRLSPMVTASDHRVQFLIKSEDGTAVDPLRLLRVYVVASDNLAQPLSAWMRVGLLPVMINGGAVLYTMEGTSHPRRFYMLVEE